MSHPAPHRYKVSGWSLLLGLFGAPVAWIAQMQGSEILSSHMCYPRQAPVNTPTSPLLMPLLTGISLAALLLALAVGVHAWLIWRKLEDESAEKGHVIDIGEGRTRFLAAFGLLSAGLFLVSIVLTGFALLFVSPCHA